MLLDELETDPKLSVPQLRQWHERNRAHPRYALTLAEAIVSGTPALERAGGWLLRRWMKERGAFPAEEWAIVVAELGDIRSHVGRLQLCQLFSEQPQLMETAPEEAANFLRAQVSDPRATVRAFGLTAWQLLAKTHPEWRAEVSRAIAAAKRDPEACVQARLRQMGVLPYPAKKKPAAIKRRARARSGTDA